MTPLQLALTSPDKMDWYFDTTPASRIISDILDFAKTSADRTVIATAINSNLAGAYYIMSGQQRLSTQQEWLREYGGGSTPAECIASESLNMADALIAALNKQP